MDGPLAQPSDLAPLTALTRLAMTCVPPELAAHPLAARLRRLELQAFGALDASAPGGGGGSGAGGAAAAALAALARGAPLLERLRICVDDRFDWGEDAALLCDYPGDVELGAPLGPGVAWPSLEHLLIAAGRVRHIDRELGLHGDVILQGGVRDLGRRPRAKARLDGPARPRPPPARRQESK
jgi:hypothetical protein